jgi:hypothetical protein
VTPRLFSAAVVVVLAAVLAGAAGGVIAASLAVGWAGWQLRARYAAPPSPVVDLPDARMEPVDGPRRLDQISGQLAIGMSDGRYFERVVRPLLLRIATGLGGGDLPDDATFAATDEPGRAPKLEELTAMVDRMEQR